jgi:hypothetical protein
MYLHFLRSTPFRPRSSAVIHGELLSIALFCFTSGAEEFVYDLKMRKRATRVGETTAGGAHMLRRRRIDDHFSIGVLDARPINPISRTNWERTGVTPDVR